MIIDKLEEKTRAEALNELSSFSADDLLELLILRIFPNAKFKIKKGSNDNYTRLLMENKPPFSLFEAEFPGLITEETERINDFYDVLDAAIALKQRADDLLALPYKNFIAAEAGVPNLAAYLRDALKAKDESVLDTLEALKTNAEATYLGLLSSEQAEKDNKTNLQQFLNDNDLDNLTKTQIEEGSVLLLKYLKGRL